MFPGSKIHSEVAFVICLCQYKGLDTELSRNASDLL